MAGLFAFSFLALMSVVGASVDLASSTYTTQVNPFTSTSLARQNFLLIKAAPFTFTAASSAIVSLASSAPTRPLSLKIVQPAGYRNALAAFTNSSNVSGVISNVALSAVSGVHASPLANAVTMPVRDPQPGAAGSFDGFTIFQNQFAL